MNCRTFESQVADWLGERLPPDQAQHMAVHQERCDRCAQAARTEAQLRSHWREAAGIWPTGDVWPKLAQRLEPPKYREALTPKGSRSPRWAWGGATLVVAVSVLTWGGRPLGTVYPGRLPGVIVATPTDNPVAAPRVTAVTLAALSDVGQVNPAVDDPVGPNMEDVWVHLKTSSKINGR